MKKFCYLSLIIFIFIILIISNTYGKDNLYLVGKLIVIDPGHGYLDPGSVYDKVYEKDINLKISLYLKDYLIKSGANVILTREDDNDLSSPNAIFRKKSDFDNRIKLINNSNANIYISIHLNYLNDKKYFGPQVFYDKNNIYFANIMQNKLNKDLNGNRKIKKIPNDTYMYSKIKIKGLLIECGFLSNDKERNLLITSDYQKKVAKSIFNGILKYFS